MEIPRIFNVPTQLRELGLAENSSHLSEKRKYSSSLLPRILVVDDDPSFGKIMLQVGKHSHVSVTFCRSLAELETLKRWRFDAAILDYDLGETSGVELAKRLESYLGSAPIILVSQTQRVETPISQWPSTVKGFLHKSVGHHALLDAALAALEVTPFR